jgi:hypothetical protein
MKDGNTQEKRICQQEYEVNWTKLSKLINHAFLKSRQSKENNFRVRKTKGERLKTKAERLKGKDQRLKEKG